MRRGFYRGDRSVNEYQMFHYAKSVDKDQNTRPILTIERMSKNEVYRN